jgi:hypothetical protein
MQPVNNAIQTGRNTPPVVSRSGFSVPSTSNWDHNSFLSAGTSSHNIALLSQAAQIRGAIALLQTQHQSIMASFGSPTDHQHQVPCPHLQNLPTESMAPGAINMPARTFLPPMRPHNLLPTPAHGQPYIQLDLNSPAAHQRLQQLQCGGPHQHRHTYSDSIHTDYSSNTTPNYPLNSAHHGAQCHPVLTHHQPASRTLQSQPETPQPRGLQLRPDARKNDAGNGASSTFMSALVSARDGGVGAAHSLGGGGGGGDGSDLQQRGRDQGRPVNLTGKAGLDTAVRPARANPPPDLRVPVTSPKPCPAAAHAPPPQAARTIYRARPPADDLRCGRARELSEALAARHGVTAKTIRDVWNRRSVQAAPSLPSRPNHPTPPPHPHRPIPIHINAQISLPLGPTPLFTTVTLRFLAGQPDWAARRRQHVGAGNAAAVDGRGARALRRRPAPQERPHPRSRRERRLRQRGRLCRWPSPPVRGRLRLGQLRGGPAGGGSGASVGGRGVAGLGLAECDNCDKYHTGGMETRASPIESRRTGWSRLAPAPARDSESSVSSEPAGPSSGTGRPVVGGPPRAGVRWDSEDGRPVRDCECCPA